MVRVASGAIVPASNTKWPSASLKANDVPSVTQPLLMGSPSMFRRVPAISPAVVVGVERDPEVPPTATSCVAGAVAAVFGGAVAAAVGGASLVADAAVSGASGVGGAVASTRVTVWLRACSGETSPVTAE